VRADAIKASGDDGMDSTPTPYGFWVGGIARRQETLVFKLCLGFLPGCYSSATAWRSRSRIETRGLSFRPLCPPKKPRRHAGVPPRKRWHGAPKKLSLRTPCSDHQAESEDKPGDKGPQSF
jgi:hypothetical protein